MSERIPQERLRKLELLREAGIEPYPKRFPPRPEVRTPIGRAVARFEREERPFEAWVAGRVVRFRDHGNSCFLDLRDQSGSMQVFLQKNRLGAERYRLLRKAIDLNDWLGVRGSVERTRKGEITVFADEAIVLCKSLAPPPEKWHGLRDIELRSRKRHVDLAVNEESRRVFETRTAVVRFVRRFLDDRGFLEVETPVLHLVAGGAAARPFRTHHNALDLDLHLRIALELHLKRLLVGGIEKVYELGRVFRNEGVDARHNPEFTMLEAYWAFADYEDMMSLWEELLVALVEEIRGGRTLRWGEAEIDFTPPFRRVSYAALLREHASVELSDEEGVRRRLEEMGVDASGLTPHKAANELFERTCEPQLIQPTFVVDYPRGISPLAKWKERDGVLVERFELFVNGLEIANAFSEMNDPLEQRRILEAQLLERDPENPAELDEDFLEALEYGMPPAGGIGMGIDRLVMMITDRTHIRDVILFPLLRPVPKGGGPATG